MKKGSIKIKNKKYFVLFAVILEEWKEGLKGNKLEYCDGLIIIFDNNKKGNITMINMLYPIDIIWIDCDGKIIQIKQSVQINDKNGNPNQIEGVLCKYVLELNAGEVEKNKFSVGDIVKF